MYLRNVGERLQPTPKTNEKNIPACRVLLYDINTTTTTVQYRQCVEKRVTIKKIMLVVAIVENAYFHNNKTKNVSCTK